MAEKMDLNRGLAEFDGELVRQHTCLLGDLLSSFAASGSALRPGVLVLDAGVVGYRASYRAESSPDLRCVAVKHMLSVALN